MRFETLRRVRNRLGKIHEFEVGMNATAAMRCWIDVTASE